MVFTLKNNKTKEVKTKEVKTNEVKTKEVKTNEVKTKDVSGIRTHDEDFAPLLFSRQSH